MEDLGRRLVGGRLPVGGGGAYRDTQLLLIGPFVLQLGLLDVS